MQYRRLNRSMFLILPTVLFFPSRIRHGVPSRVQIGPLYFILMYSKRNRRRAGNIKPGREMRPEGEERC